MRSLQSFLLLAFLFGGEAGANPAVVRPTAPRFDSLSQGIEEARKRGNCRIFVFVDARQCGDCGRMNSLIIPSRIFKDFVEDKVVVRVDVNSEEGARLGEQYGISSAPAWIVMTPDGVLSWLHKGMTPQAQWLEFLSVSEERWNYYQKMLAEETANPTDGQRVFENARETFRRHGDSQAERAFRRLVGDPSTPPAILEESLAYLATIEMNGRRLEEARGHLETLLQIGKDPTLRERAELRLVEVEIGKNDASAAKKRLDQFVTAHPDSAKKTVEDLERIVFTLVQPPAAEGERR
jgi:Thioredoxin-like/Tetratricopeptide repeat-like domain